MVVREVLPGVGIADEPPDVALDDDGGVESFGTYLSKVLYWALEQCRDTAWDRFLDAAANALQAAGIDPMQPHRHPRRPDIEELDRRGRIALKSASEHAVGEERNARRGSGRRRLGRRRRGRDGGGRSL